MSKSELIPEDVLPQGVESVTTCIIPAGVIDPLEPEGKKLMNKLDRSRKHIPLLFRGFVKYEVIPHGGEVRLIRLSPDTPEIRVREVNDYVREGKRYTRLEEREKIFSVHIKSPVEGGDWEYLEVGGDSEIQKIGAREVTIGNPRLVIKIIRSSVDERPEGLSADESPTRIDVITKDPKIYKVYGIYLETLSRGITPKKKGK